MKSQSGVGDSNSQRYLDALRLINRIATHADSLDDFLSDILDQMLGFCLRQGVADVSCDPDS
jgi:hypothetical protein